MKETLTSDTALNESLRADILLLSTFLAGRHEPSRQSQPVNETLPLFVHLSTLLTIGNNPSHDGQNVNAVVGTATTNGIDFLVCTDNQPSHQADVDQSRMDNATEVADTVRITPIEEAGRKLLDKWDVRTGSKEVEISDNFTFEEHLQDLFSVITALNCDDIRDLIRFELLILQRAHRKIAWRVLELSTHWGQSPFDIIFDHLDNELPSKIFEFQYRDPEFHELIQSYVRAEPPSPTSGRNCGPVYSINAQNAHQWLLALKCSWAQLQSCLLVQESDEGNTTRLIVRKDPPTVQTIDNILAMMFLFEALMPVLKHLLSAQGAAYALANAEIQQASKSGGTMSSYDITDSDKYDLDLVLPKNDYYQLPQKSVARLLHAMKSVLAWQTSCRYIFKKARQFRLKPFHWCLAQLYCYDRPLQSRVFDVKRVLPLLRAWQGPTENPCGIDQAERIIRQACDAKVHAEAALMQWIATVKDVHLSQDWPIGVKTCCQMCWLLHHAYNRQQSSGFVLPDTHGVLLPWLPPPGLPDSVLNTLRQALLDKTSVSTHQKTSSPRPSASDVVIPSLHQLRHAFMRLRRPAAQI